MTTPRPNLLVIGQIVVAARPDGIETAEAIGIADGAVVLAGAARDVREAATHGARIVEVGESAVLPGLHDFHLHLVGMARALRIVDLGDAESIDEIVERVAAAAIALPHGAWVRGDGWRNELLAGADLDRLESVLGGRPALLKSHDRHSAWASREALRVAGISDETSDPPGGRIERGSDRRPNGVLRERAADLVADHAARLVGEPLSGALREVVDQLAGFGFTSVTDAGDPTDQNGTGSWAEFGDSFSNLAVAAPALAPKMRINLDLPASAVDAAVERGLRTGAPFLGHGVMRVGWAKLYADGALGSHTAALFAPYTCAANDDERGIMRIGTPELDDLILRARNGGIALAIHAIGDRAVAEVLDGLERAPTRQVGTPADRIEHAQLVRSRDRPRFATLDVTASVQPIHAPSDRATAERCWADRLEDAYAFGSLASAGARLAFGSDAPIETPNPWHGIFAAVRRRAPGEGTTGWLANEAVSPVAALSAYTLGPALASGFSDLGHLRPGARADLAVLNVDLDTLLAADERLASVRSRLTLVDGREVHLA